MSPDFMATEATARRTRPADAPHLPLGRAIGAIYVGDGAVPHTSPKGGPIVGWTQQPRLIRRWVPAKFNWWSNWDLRWELQHFARLPRRDHGWCRGTLGGRSRAWYEACARGRWLAGGRRASNVPYRAVK